MTGTTATVQQQVLELRFTSIDVVGTCASVRLGMDNWTAHRFTDLFNLVRFDRWWKSFNKVFDLHPDPA